jgi:hypothetical protein
VTAWTNPRARRLHRVAVGLVLAGWAVAIALSIAALVDEFR